LQIESILYQLANNDELVIVDDCSTDTSIQIIKNFEDPRIHLYINESNLGYVKTFEKCLRLASGNIIFLSDQDDYWLPGRVAIMKENIHAHNALLVCSSMSTTTQQGKAFEKNDLVLQESATLFNIISIFTGKNLYYGSLMCFDRKLLSYTLPFPAYIKSHDVYLALTANFFGQVVHCREILTLRTITGHNLSDSNRSLFSKIVTRFFFLRVFLRSAVLKCVKLLQSQ
jgi:glycosyltransferase involved in cell wall biosynthesis